MKKKTNRLLSILLCCVMLIGLLPTTALAWTAPTLSGNGGNAWNIQLSDEGLLSWDEQQNATSYDIEVDKTAMGSTLTRIESINTNSYNLIDRFKELKIENGTYYFQIKANGPDTTSSTISFRYISPESKLPAPLNLSWDGTVAKWDSVANATKYTVNLYTDDGYLQLSKTATETQYDWQTEATDGRWFEVIATADGYRDSNPAVGPRYGTYSWTAPTLSGNYTAWTVQLSDEGLLSWDEQQNATSYDIEVDETAMGGTVTKIESINTNSYNLIDRFKELKIENGTYYFQIKANGPDTTSGTISFRYVSPQNKLSAPLNLSWDGTVAKWDSVANATQYTVNLYSDSGYLQLSKTATETQYNWGENIYDNGFWFEVVATADGYRDSDIAESPKYDGIVSPTAYNIGAYAYDATVGTTGSGGQVYLVTDKGTDGWSTEGYIKYATGNTTVALNANPAAGYKFVEWRQGTAGATISTEANYQFTASEDKYLYAVFETISSTEYDIELEIYDITYTATDGGTVSIQTNQGFSDSVSDPDVKGYATENTAVTITAVPKAGYEFVAWKKSAPQVQDTFSTNATYTFTATADKFTVNESPDLFLYAVFQETQPQATTYLISCVAHNLSGGEAAGTVFLETDKGGTGYAASQQKYATENATVRLRAVAEPGYQFVAWRKGSPTDANATVSTQAEYQFTATEAVWMYAVFQQTANCTIECIPFDVTGGENNGQSGVGGTVSIQTDKGNVSGTNTQSLQATRNSSVTVNAVAASGYEFLGWKKASPYVQDFVATTASYTFDINEELNLYAVFQEASTPTYNVVITAGTGMSTTGNTNQTVVQGSPITSVVYTAADGYYFPTDYSVTAQNDISVTRNSYTQITVSGTPTAAVNLTLTNATAKTKETTPSASFTATGPDTGTLSGVTSGMKYSTDGGNSWTNINSNADINLTGLSACTISVVKTGDGNTTTDSNAQSITVTKAAAPTTVVGVACTTGSNDDGKLQNVTAAMEYKLSTANNWTDVTGSDITSLANGIYYVRVKASGTVLASDYQTVNVPAYSAVPTYSITLDKAGTHTFTAADAGYAAQTPATVTVTNTGNSATGALTVALSGTDAASFTLNKTNIADIAVSGSDTFTVVPKTGLSAGTYTATVTVSGGNSITGSFNVSFTVNAAAPTYSIALSPSGTQTFTAATVGYGAQTAKTITVSNTGTGATGALTVALSGNNAGSFTLNKNSITDIAVGSNDTFTVVPNTGLAAGTYTATVTVSGGNSITANFNVSFTVNAASPTYSIALSPSGTQTFTAATVGYGAQTAKTITVNNTGTGATGALTVALSGNNASSFTLSKTSIADIAVSGNDTFTVVPNTGLAAGTYTATVTVSGGNSITASFNVSFTVNSGGNGGGGGGGYTPATYSVTVDKADNGDVSVSPKSASKGTTVTVTVDPDKGYALETLTVADENGKEIELTNKGDGKYTFKMPASKVTVKATFMEDNTMLNYFVDVFATDYYYDAVLWAVEEGITNGTSATTFSPGADCTRAQMATFLWRAAGSPEPVGKTNPFADIAADAYYAKAVQWAYEQGITGGTSATTFSPDAACTRAQMVTFLHRVADSKKPASSTNPFTDVPDAYYTEAVQWAYEEEITGGTSATTFSPDATCTRGQMVTFLWRFFAK